MLNLFLIGYCHYQVWSTVTCSSFRQYDFKGKVSKNTETAANLPRQNKTKQVPLCSKSNQFKYYLVKCVKPLKINIKTASKSLLKNKETAAKLPRQNKTKQAPLCSKSNHFYLRKVQNSKNQVKNCKQKALCLVLKTEVSGKI